MRVCVATPGPIAVTETFIRAHIERLPFEILPLRGCLGEPTWNERTLRSLYQATPSPLPNRALNLLPRFAEFRLRKRLFPTLSTRELLVRWLREQSIDLVLAEYGPTGAALASACEFTNVPLVVHFHGYDASRYDILEANREGYARMFKSAAAIIVVSQAMLAKLKSLGCPADKLVLSHYGPDPAFFEVKPNYESKVVLAVGRLTAKKAPHLTILAFAEVLKKFPELHMVMVGEGELRGVCRDLIHALGLEGKVELVGAADSSAVRSLMAKAFVFVQHSVVAEDGDSEGTPVAILEAGAAGLPVVSTFHAGIPDVVQNNVTGLLVPEHDVRAMAQAITALVSDRRRAEEMGRHARCRIHESFTLERHLQTITKAIAKGGGAWRCHGFSQGGPKVRPHRVWVWCTIEDSQITDKV